MHKLLASVATTAALFGLTACGQDSDSAPAATIHVRDMSFSPASVTISRGQSVEWVFDDNGLPHDVVEDAGEFRSDLVTEGSYTHTFDAAGTFGYHCTPHPMMVGTVVVRD